MPSLRDFSTAYETVTTDGGLTLPMPAYAAGDLILVFVNGDTGAPTWGCSNGIGAWNQLFARNNTSSFVCFWKYAAAAGEGDIVVTATIAETYCGCAMVWEDVFQGYTAGSPPVQTNVAQAASTRFNMPTLATSAPDSAVVCAIGSSAVAQAHLCEGIAHLTAVSDGAAEGCGFGWFFRAAAGITPSDVKGAMNVAGAGVAAVVEVRAPAGGAALRPAYTVSDASILLTPQPGIAWDGNTAIAATADTNFGTSISGRTCNDATVATAVNDIGLDAGSFMAFAGVANTANATAMSGAESVVSASRYDVGTRNILGHFRGPTAIANQTLSPVASGRGVWFGMRSGVTAGTNWMVWQVHGSDAQKPGYFQPFIVNAGNADTIAVAGTLSASDVRRYGFWRGGLGVLTGQACFGPLWAMDTQVLAGGTVSTPLNLADVVRAVADQKLRLSAQLQGNSQALMLQAVQFGNGGPNPVVLNLDSTAIEFPARKNAAAKIVNYNGIDDSVGLTYYPGATDTIIHRSSVISSANKYHWRIHASASASATYDFTGLSLIGAGDVQLRAVTTFTGMTFTDCPTITQNSAVISGCSFADSKVISAALADMDNISGCEFVSSGTGHAIEVGGAASTITLSGNTFTGYAVSNGSTGNEAVYVNIATGTVTLNIVGGGNVPSIRTAGATVVVNANVSVTLTGLKNLTEVRVFNAGTTTEIAGTGAESVTTGSHLFSVGAGVSVDISILALGYQNLRVLAYSTTADASVPITQVVDRQYANA